MRILAFDTSTSVCSVAVADNGRVHLSEKSGIRKHERVLFEQIDRAMDKMRLSFPDLDGVAFGRGPGSFMGVRITVAAAHAFGYVHQLPLIGLSTLEVLAQQAIERCGAQRILAVLDARGGEVYYGYYRAQGGIAVPEAWEGVAALSGVPGLDKFDGVVWGNGSGSGKRTRQEGATVESAAPSADAMLRLAEGRIKRGARDSDLLPVYLRGGVARTVADP